MRHALRKAHPPRNAYKSQYHLATWGEYWRGWQLRKEPPDPEYDESYPRMLVIRFSAAVPLLTSHALFFQLVAFGEIESVGIIGDSTSYVQYLRRRDAARAKIALQGRRLSELTVAVKMADIPCKLLDVTIDITMNEGAHHHPVLIVFDPEEKMVVQLTKLLRSYFPSCQHERVFREQRTFLWVVFDNIIEAGTILSTVQTKLAAHWDLHTQLVTTQLARVHGVGLENTAKLVYHLHMLPSINMAEGLPDDAHSISPRGESHSLAVLLQEEDIYTGKAPDVSSNHNEQSVPLPQTRHPQPHTQPSSGNSTDSPQFHSQQPTANRLPPRSRNSWSPKASPVSMPSQKRSNHTRASDGTHHYTSERDRDAREFLERQLDVRREEPEANTRNSPQPTIKEEEELIQEATTSKRMKIEPMQEDVRIPHTQYNHVYTHQTRHPPQQYQQQRIRHTPTNNWVHPSHYSPTIASVHDPQQPTPRHTDTAPATPVTPSLGGGAQRFSISKVSMETVYMGLVIEVHPSQRMIDIGCVRHIEVQKEDVEDAVGFDQLAIGERVAVRVTSITMYAVRGVFVHPSEIRDLTPLHPAVMSLIHQ